MKYGTWITPLAAIELLASKGRPAPDPMALAKWAEMGELKSRAKIIYRDGKPANSGSTQEIASDFWKWLRKEGAIWEAAFFTATIEILVSESSVDWSKTDAPRLGRSTFTEVERWALEGVEFHYNDLIRCIRKARNEKVPKPKVDEQIVKIWLRDFISAQGSENITTRLVEGEAKRKFKGQRGAITLVRAHLPEMRSVK